MKVMMGFVFARRALSRRNCGLRIEVDMTVGTLGVTFSIDTLLFISR